MQSEKKRWAEEQWRRGLFNRKRCPIPRGQVRAAIKRHFESLENVKGKTFLTVGGGKGDPLSRELVSLGAKVVNLDMVRNVLLYSRSRRGGGLTPVEADFRRLPFKTGSFDGILSFYAFDCFARPESVDTKSIAGFYSEQKRVLKGGGLLLKVTSMPLWFAKPRVEEYFDVIETRKNKTSKLIVGEKVS